MHDIVSSGDAVEVAIIRPVQPIDYFIFIVLVACVVVVAIALYKRRKKNGRREENENTNGLDKTIEVGGSRDSNDSNSLHIDRQ